MTQSAIYLTPSLAVEYVRVLEGKHREFKSMVADSDVMVDYVEIFYESLLDSVYSNNVVYLQMIESFLDIEPQITSTNITAYRREHPLPCYQKIENWEEIQRELKAIGSVENESESGWGSIMEGSAGATFGEPIDLNFIFKLLSDCFISHGVIGYVATAGI